MQLPVSQLSLGLFLASLTGCSRSLATGAPQADVAVFDDAGHIRKPKDYRDRYQMLGAWMVLAPGGNEMHYTYASPGAAELYRKNGRFPDGTVLVKEVFASTNAQLSTGDVHWAKETKLWFVMVKDDKGRFQGNPLWGNGWGWALFKSDAPDTQVATDFAKDCIPCHTPASQTDWLYVRGYPVLGAQ